MKFKKGQKVVIKHQRNQGEYEVVNAFDKLDKPMELPYREPVTGYVRISNDKENNLGYWPENLELVK